MEIIIHRVNTRSQLEKVPVDFGAEIDLRTDGSNIVLHHDPLKGGEKFSDWIAEYGERGTLVLNVKESGIEVDRPSAVTAVVKEKGNILVAITASGQIWVDRRQVDPRAVRANIERLHAENPQGSVVIQADKNSTTEMLIQVMDAARQAGVYNVSIAAQE